MLQSADIQEAVLQLWNTSTNSLTGLTVVVPGGLWFGRVPEKDANGNLTASPYASLQVTERPATYTGILAVGAPGYVQPFLVEIRVYSDQPGEATGEIQRTMDALLDFAKVSFSLHNGQSLLVLHSNRQPGELRIDQARRKQGDVLQGAGRYEWLCQGSRP